MKKKYSIGVDLGGTKIKVGIVNEAGRIIQKASVDTCAEQGPDKVVSQIKKGINSLLVTNKKQIQGIGIGSPGTVSTKKGTVENSPNLAGWKKVHLGRIITKEFGLPTFVENDANAAAIGELIYGAGKDLKSFIMITLGTGVGGGIIHNRKLFKGDFGAAGEIGHITINYKGPKCKCGAYGCLETYLGNKYIIKNVVEKLKNNKSSLIYKLTDNNLKKLNPKIIHEASLLGDEFSKKVIENLGEVLGYGLASVVNLLDISTIIIGGGVAGFGKPLFNSVKKTMKARVLSPIRPRVKVKQAKLKNNAGIKGASSLVLYD